MQPSEPTPADVSAVAAAIGEPAAQPAQPTPVQNQPTPVSQPAPQPQIASPQMQPSAPTPQPAPTQQPQDPFSTLFVSEPAAPAAATPAPQPTPQPTPTPQQTPTEPVQPTPTAPETPVEQPQVPGQQPAPDNAIPGQSPQGQQQYETYDEYINRVTGDVPAAPNAPDPSTINPDDPAAIKGFFDDMLSTAEKRFEANYERKQSIQRSEKTLWDGAFVKYPSLRSNTKGRDLVHNIRMGYFQRGQAITPTQAADILLDSMGQQYKQGVADNQVITTIENVQPQGGGGTQPVTTSLERENVLTEIQTGGEAALAAHLDREIQAGRL